jgi:tRNA (guanine-N7-)-methyltransferase
MSLGSERVRHDRPDVLGPGIRTYKPRRTRMSARQHRAIDEQSCHVLQLEHGLIDLAHEWGPGVPVVMEIGFGSGGTTAAMAAADPGTGILAIDIHTPGVGDLLSRVGQQGLANIRVMEADALLVLDRMIPPHSLAGVRTYFPDPWPKSRHHKRRLVQAPILDLVRSRLRPGGTWHLATDWAPYARAMAECFGADARWSGGEVPRPGWRPQTPYERRALLEGRTITDLVYATH